MPPIPDHDAARAVFAFGDLALEAAVVERVILGLHGEAAVLRAEARLFRHGPALQHAVVLEPEIVVKPGRIVFLHDVLQPALGCDGAGAARLRRSLEVALAAIAREPAARVRRAFSHASLPRPWPRDSWRRTARAL